MRHSTEPCFNWWQSYLVFAVHCRRALLIGMQQTAEAWVQALRAPAVPLLPVATEQPWLRTWLFWQDCLQHSLPGTHLPDALALSALLAKPAGHSESGDKMLLQLIRLMPPPGANNAVAGPPQGKPPARRSRGKPADGQ
ncbi:MAG: hypothetical protein U1F63_04775 [Chitinivorax sp.]